MSDLQTRVAMLSQELQRESQALRQKTEELNQYDIHLKNAVQ